MANDKLIIVRLDDLPEAVNAAQAAAASGASPKLDTQETSIPYTVPSDYQRFLRRGVERDWTNAQELYRRIDHRDGTHRTILLSQCRAHASFAAHKSTRQVRVLSSRCNLRWCPLCIRTKRWTITQSVSGWLTSVKRPKFITLTLAHSSASLKSQIDKLYKAFILLRRRPLFKQAIKGGIWFFQLTRSEKGGRYHPHLHIVCDGLYIDKYKLSAEWNHVSKTSKIVDIKAVKDVKEVAKYVARYATAPCRLLDFSDNEQIEIFDALNGRRICGTWGTGKDIRLKPAKPEDANDWIRLGSFWDIVGLCQKRSDYALIFRCWRDSVPLPPDFEIPKPPPVIPPSQHRVEPVTYNQMMFEWSRCL